MAAPSRAAHDPGTAQRSKVSDSQGARKKPIHHGQTMAAWVGSLTAMVAVLIGGFAVVFQNWVVFGIGVALLVAAGLASLILQKTGHGAR
jgi:Na+-translocating ferredoxin:NAD+ oxidoreductase RnfD subunit